MKHNNFSLIDKFTIVSIALIGIALTYFEVVNFSRIREVIDRFKEGELIYKILEGLINYKKLIPYLILSFGAILLLIKANTLAWRIAYIPLIIITFFFCKDTLELIMSENLESELIAFIVFTQGILITISFVLLLLSLYICSSGFKEKLNA